MKETSEATKLVMQIVEANRKVALISPAWVATEVARLIGAMRLQNTDPVWYTLGHQQVRQIARGVLRDLFDPEGENENDKNGQHPLFPDLNWRYPIKRKADEDPKYVLLDEMSDEDWEYNIKRATSEIERKTKKLDALIAWGLPSKRRRVAS